MLNIAQIAAKILLVTQAAWLMLPAHAQEPPARPASHSAYKHHPHLHHRHHHMGSMQMDQSMQAHAGPLVDVPLGGFFSARQREEARAFYSEPEHQGYCMTDHKRRHKDCLTQGQKKPWRQGHALPASVAVYRLPRPLEIQIGPPPTGYRYRRVGADIVLLQPHTLIVVDTIEDAVR